MTSEVGVLTGIERTSGKKNSREFKKLPRRRCFRNRGPSAAGSRRPRPDHRVDHRVNSAAVEIRTLG